MGSASSLDLAFIDAKWMTQLFFNSSTKKPFHDKWKRGGRREHGGVYVLWLCIEFLLDLLALFSLNSEWCKCSDVIRHSWHFRFKKWRTGTAGERKRGRKKEWEKEGGMYDYTLSALNNTLLRTIHALKTVLFQILTQPAHGAIIFCYHGCKCPWIIMLLVRGGSVTKLEL